MRAKALEPVTLVRSPTLTNSEPGADGDRLQTGQLHGGNRQNFRRDNRHRLTLGIQVSVVVQDIQTLNGPKPDLLRLKGGGLQRSLGNARF